MTQDQSLSSDRVMAGLVQMPWLLTALIGVGYYIAARLSLLLQVQPENIAVFWPAAGLSAGALIALGPAAMRSVGIAVVLATFIANVASGANIFLSLIFGLCNAAECLLTALIVWRVHGLPFRLDTIGRVLGFLAATLVATAVAALPASIALIQILHVEVPLLTLWHTWLESDAVGIATVAPLFISLPAAFSERVPFARLVEGFVILVLLVATAIHVFANLPAGASWPSLIPIALLFPLLLWLAVRCPPIFAASGAFAVALAIVSCVINGYGALGQQVLPLPDRVFAAQVAMLTLSLCALALAAVITSQRSIAAQLRVSDQRQRIASAAAGLGVFEWRIKEDKSIWENERMFEIFGHAETDGPLSYADLSNRYIDPRQRDQFQREVETVLGRDEGKVAARIRRKDGVWRDIEIIGNIERDAAGMPERVVGVIADVTERRRSEERQALLIGELDHRVKNTLERVAMLITSMRHQASGIDEFADTLDGRIQAMSRAHQLLSKAHWSSVDLGTIVAEQIEPHIAGGRATVSGPSVRLSTQATQVVSMVMHELATNAEKYGALKISCPAGRVSVSWEQHVPEEARLTDPASGEGAAGSLRIVWQETGGPQVTSPSRKGFGTKVILEPIAYELAGKVDLRYEPAGVNCRIELPLDRVLAT